MKSSMRRTPWACCTSFISGATCRLVSVPKSTPRREASRTCSNGPSSARTFIVSLMKFSLNWMSWHRSGVLDPFGTSLIQLCGRLGPASTRLPGSNSPMKSPTKYRPVVATTR